MAAAQNTISILETIKRKMQKFDDKSPQQNNVAQAAPVAPVAVATQNEVAPKAPPEQAVANFKKVDSNIQAQAYGDFDDLDFDDIDLDNENAFPKMDNNVVTPAPQAIATKASEPEAENHDDLEDFDLDDQDDLNIDHHDTALAPVAAQAPTATVTDVSSEDDDLSFDDLDDDFAKDVVVAAPKQEAPKALSMDDLYDLDIDDLEEEVVAKASPVKQAEPSAQYKKEDSFDEFERELMSESLQSGKTQLPSVNKVPNFQKPIEHNASLNHAKRAVVTVAPVMPTMQRPMPQAPVLMNNNPVTVGVVSKSSMLNQDTVRQTADSVKKLIDAKNMVAGIRGFSQSPVLTEVAIQLLEPKLEKWLNENLSHIVEDIVREEIKNILSKEDLK